MIYPAEFPLDADTGNPESQVYNALRKLDEKDFDIFYSRKFSRVVKGERQDYEIDFIVVDLRNSRCNTILCIEVKGGKVTYSGTADQWYQNGKPMDSPQQQVISAMHSLVSRYPDMSGLVPFGWALWFPQMINPGQQQLPTQLNEHQLLDELALSKPAFHIEELFSYIRSNSAYRTGCDLKTYQVFKESLLRGFGHVVPLHKQIALADQRFIQLTQQQLQLLKLVGINQNVLVTGPAGSGKTVLATTLAQEAAEEGQRVLLLTFNRVLNNNIRYNLGKNSPIEVATYHAIARRTIAKVDEAWWEVNKGSDSFWDLDIPAKFDEALAQLKPEFDVLIIDEGQDFQEFWYESLERLLKPTGRFYVFMDEQQNIFNAYKGIPSERHFFNFPLTENCRNTKQIVELLQSYINAPIKSKADAPAGEPVQLIPYRNDTEQLNLIKNEWERLVQEEGISPDKIVLMFNADKRKSCLAKTRKFGKFPIEAVDRKTGSLNKNNVNYTSINTFKGLEADVVFIIDTDKVENPDYKMLYTQASRAKYILKIFKGSNA